MIEQFKMDVDRGLSATPKRLHSRYFYDEVGDDLFVQIMHMPEYYLTDSELEIFTEKASQIIKRLDFDPTETTQVIELGAGDGTKTIHLLTELLTNKYPINYIPVDISQNALNGLSNMLSENLPELKFMPMQGEYFGVLNDLKKEKQQKVILFLGSNLGNLEDHEAKLFIRELSNSLNPGDRILLGVDLIKEEEIVLPAYNDSGGITKAFNLNLLTRINSELGGEFDLNHWDHNPTYNSEEGIMRSYLTSLKDQRIRINSIGKQFSFKKGERVLVEISRKYNDEILGRILNGSSLNIQDKVLDSSGYFADYILKKETN